MIEKLESVIENLEGIINDPKWTLPSGQHALIVVPNGHLSVMHTSYLKEIKELLITIRNEKQKDG